MNALGRIVGDAKTGDARALARLTQRRATSLRTENGARLFCSNRFTIAASAGLTPPERGSIAGTGSERWFERYGNGKLAVDGSLPGEHLIEHEPKLYRSEVSWFRALIFVRARCSRRCP